MADVKVITQTKYYAIASNLTHFELSSFDAACAANDVKFILRHNIGYNPFITNTGQEMRNYAATIDLMNSDGSVAEAIRENNWQLQLENFGMTGGYHYTTMWVKYIDSFGYAPASEQFSISVDGFIKSYKRFIALNQYEGYKYAVMAIKCGELKRENMQLREQMNLVKQENAELKNRLSATA